MANWRNKTLDRLILRAIERGFSDPDFDGWDELDPQTRISAVNSLLHHNGLGQIIFRKTFADAAFVGGPPLRDPDTGLGNYSGVISKMRTLGDYYRVQIVLEDDWLLYIRLNWQVWDAEAPERTELAL